MPIVHVPDAEEPIEVPADAIEVQDDEDVIYKDKDDYNSMIQSRLQRKERSLKDSLKDDDEYFREAAEARGIELREDGAPKGALKDEEVRELRQKASMVDSLQEQVQTYEAQIEETRRSQLETEVHKLAGDHIEEGAEEDVMRNVLDDMSYDDELGWVVTDEDGQPVYDGGDALGISHAVDEVQDRKSYLFKDTSADAGPPDEPGSSSSTITRSQLDKEIDKAMAEGDDERLDELEAMVAEDQIQ